VRDALARFFAFDAPWFADRDSQTKLQEIYTRVREDRTQAALHDLLGQLLRIGWPEERAPIGLRQATWGVLGWGDPVGIGQHVHGLWADLNARTLHELLTALAIPAAEQPAFAATIAAALVADDATARAEVARRVIERRASVPELLASSGSTIAFGSAPDIDLRLFALLTDGLADDERLRWATRVFMGGTHVLDAATAWIRARLGADAGPELPIPPDLDEIIHARPRVRFLRAARALAPEIYGDLVEGVFANSEVKVYVDRGKAIAMTVGDEVHELPKGGTVTRLGTVVASFARGRTTMKRCANEAAATRELQKKLAS
jgi:hypothetical protein